VEPALVQCTALILAVEGVVKLADEPNGCREVVKGGCSFALKFSVTRSAAITEAERRH